MSNRIRNISIHNREIQNFLTQPIFTSIADFSEIVCNFTLVKFLLPNQRRQREKKKTKAVNMIMLLTE